MEKSEKTVEPECVTGCMNYSGGEIRHHKDCGFYPESLSQMYDARDTEVQKLQEMQDNAHHREVSLIEENARLREALQKIADPIKYHHWEEDPYTRAGCFQYVAHEALKKAEK